MSDPVRLIAPFSAPLRHVTLHGGWQAPRWLTPLSDEDAKKGKKPGTTGDPKKAAHPDVIDHYHQGVDLLGRPGEDVLAVADAKVLPILNPGYCQCGVKLQLADGRQVVYCDLGKALVKVGDIVRAGQAVGKVGDRGFVHVALRAASGEFMDPLGVLPYVDMRVGVPPAA